MAAQQFECEVVALVNAKRASGAVCDGETKPAVPTLVRDAALTANARAHSEDMVTHGYISQTRNDGTLASEWAMVGYCGGYGSATVAKGQADAKALVDSSFLEPTICSNLMSAAGARIGVGIVTDAVSGSVLGATMVIGAMTPD